MQTATTAFQPSKTKMNVADIFDTSEFNKKQQTRMTNYSNHPKSQKPIHNASTDQLVANDDFDPYAVLQEDEDKTRNKANYSSQEVIQRKPENQYANQYMQVPDTRQVDTISGFSGFNGDDRSIQQVATRSKPSNDFSSSQQLNQGAIDQRAIDPRGQDATSYRGVG